MVDELLNVVVCYSNEKEVIRYANSLCSQSIASHITLVVVVNKLSDSSWDFENELNKLDLNVLTFYPGDNLGYLNGLLYGYKEFISTKKKKPSWIIMSNTDIEFKDSYLFEKFLNNQYSDDIACVAPSIYAPKHKSYENPQYTARHSLKSINKRIFIFERPILAYIYLKLATLKSKLKKKIRQKSQYVYSAHGCFFVVRHELADELAKKKYKALMYSEEAYVAEVLRKLGKMCFYDSSLEVYHNESSVTGLLEIKKKSQYYLDSLKVIKDEFY